MKILPGNLDSIYGVIVFQDLTRDLVKNYRMNMPKKLSNKGELPCQFADLIYRTMFVDGDTPQEHSVRWNQDDIKFLIKNAGWLSAHFGVKQR